MEGGARIMLDQTVIDQIATDLEEVMDWNYGAKLLHDLIVKLDTAKMELEAGSPCMSYTCVCLEDVEEAQLLLSLLCTLACFFGPEWKDKKDASN
jgi:hypothetical protein